MYTRRFCETYVPLIAFIVSINTLSIIFFMRAPVILVSDMYFSEVYGARSEQVKRLEASFKCFTQIKIVRILEEETDTISIAESIQRSSRNPKAVFFPFAYSNAAEYYASTIVPAQKGNTKTFVFLDRNQASQDLKPYYYVRSDTDIDFHRAGTCAAVLGTIGANSSDVEAQKKSIYFISNLLLNQAEKESFIEGIQEGLFPGRIDFISGYENRNWDTAAAIVIYGPAPAFLQAQVEVPIILFSWYNSASYLPRSIKVLVDDSPYFVIPNILKQARNAIEGTRGFSVPSNFMVLYERIPNRSMAMSLMRVTSNFFNFNSNVLRGKVNNSKNP